jgi:hypothetical protein
MKYTIRFAHLEHAPSLKAGDAVKAGDVLGEMGSSGQSTAAHLHIDCVQGYHTERYRLENIERDTPRTANPRQMNYFIEDDLFRDKIVITTPYADPEYQRAYGKVHYGYDVVPEGRHNPGAPLLIYWNRSVPGTVLRVDYDPAGYGNCLYVGFEVQT